MSHMQHVAAVAATLQSDFRMLRVMTHMQLQHIQGHVTHISHE